MPEQRIPESWLDGNPFERQRVQGRITRDSNLSRGEVQGVRRAGRIDRDVTEQSRRDDLLPRLGAPALPAVEFVSDLPEMVDLIQRVELQEPLPGRLFYPRALGRAQDVPPN